MIVSPPGGGEILSIAKSGVGALEDAIGRPSRASPTLQGAARAFVDALVARAPRTTVLARVLVTRPFRELPREEHAFADRLAKTRGVRDRLRPDTPVLALLASRGELAHWNDPRLSRLHRAVPLTDAAFVRTIPMVARMLDDLGFPLENSPDAKRRRLGDASGMGVFHVRDASAPENDALIPERRFVDDHGVRSVFGLGSAYLDGSVLVVLVFSRDLVDHETVVKLAPLAAALKRRTYPAVSAGRVFEDDVG